jgi:uncharacterized protein YkwD
VNRTTRIVALAVAVLAPMQTATATASQRATTTHDLLQAMNNARRTYGLRPLHLDARLGAAARSHSSDMLSRNYFAHGDFAARMASFHVRGPAEGENLAWGTGPYGRAAQIVREWLASPEHRANLLRPGFTRTGIGLVRGTFLGNTGATVVTADFAGS